MRIENDNSIMTARPLTPDRALVTRGESASRDLAVPVPAGPPAVASPLSKMSDGLDIRAMSPRQMASMSLDLYTGGFLDWDEYAELAFQPELHPDYDRTIGALTGEKARPDRPKDFIREWEDRYEFEQRYNADDPERLDRTLRILTLFKKIEVPTILVA